MPSAFLRKQAPQAAFLCILTIAACGTSHEPKPAEHERRSEMLHALRAELLQVWYPAARDTVYGGFLCDFTHDWRPQGPQHKMLVTQSRHVWTASQAYSFFGEEFYRTIASHGFQFLKNKMWDETYGGFYMLRSRAGAAVDYSYRDEKRAYGHAFALYALAAYYEASRDRAALQLAKKTFYWLEEHSHDAVLKGYFDHIARDGSLLRKDRAATLAWDLPSIGWKDQNSSIHLLEAFTALYRVWPDSLVRARLDEMLALIREVFTHEHGYLILNMTRDWKPVSFRDSSATVREANYGFDHVSFGHDVETAYLMLEAAHALGMPNDARTMTVAKKMVDHALAHGWDKQNGGFYERGYYFAGADSLTIISMTKTWWVQAEGLNALLLFAKLFPQEKKYVQAFEHQWDYIKKYLIDHERGEWYEEGLDRSPEQVRAPKARDWKVNYHNSRALMNCIKMLKPDEGAF